MELQNKIGDNPPKWVIIYPDSAVSHNCRKPGLLDKLEMDNVRNAIVERFW